jgi:hypothetical protein
MRVIFHEERPHPSAQLRFTDIDGHRAICFATDATTGQLADLELRHRRRARCEERIRWAKDTGLRNLPLLGFAQNQLWCELVAMARELTAWMKMLALDGPPGLGAQAAAPVSPPPAALCAASVACGCASPRPGPGPPRSPLRSPTCSPDTG